MILARKDVQYLGVRSQFRDFCRRTQIQAYHQYRDPGQSCNRILFQGEILGALNLTGRARSFHGALGFQAKPRLTDPILFLDKGEQTCFFQSGQGCQECHLHDTRMPADLYTPGNGRAIHHLREAQ